MYCQVAEFHCSVYFSDILKNFLRLLLACFSSVVLFQFGTFDKAVREPTSGLAAASSPLSCKFHVPSFVDAVSTTSRNLKTFVMILPLS
jgi:hypothetical protein